MKLRRHQIRLQGLLKETITLLCKNGLKFRKGFAVDALIGITTDDSETFLVKVEDVVKSAECGDSDNEAGLPSRALRKRRSDGRAQTAPAKRRRSRSENDDSDSSDVKREPDDDIVVKQEQPDNESQAEGPDGVLLYDASPEHTGPN